MCNLLESLMIDLFTLANFLWLMRIWRSNTHFSSLEKCRAVSFALAYLIGVFLFAMQGRIVPAVVCFVGYGISRVTVGVVFHEKYKEVSIPL